MKELNIEAILEHNPVKKMYIITKDYISEIPYNIYTYFNKERIEQDYKRIIQNEKSI